VKITSPKLDKLNSTNLSLNEKALLCCQAALELRDKGDYEGALEVMRPFWKRLGERPQSEGLQQSVAVEVLLCVGILTDWIGSTSDIKHEETAKNLISEAITFYESIGDLKKVAEARADLAYCYWREGGLDEARIMLTEALQRLTTEGNTRARALLRLAIVEWSAARYSDALRILTDNASLFKKITNHAITGGYHSQLAMVYDCLATFERRNDYIERAIDEYEIADQEFKEARNTVYRADVKNNLAFLLYRFGRFQAAYEYLDHARRLAINAKDKTRVAQIDETRAQVLIAENKFEKAESVARSAVSVLEKSGQQCLLADALITQGIALARLHHYEQSQFTLQRAIEVAYQVGAYNKAGLAALTLIEELDPSIDTLYAAYDKASQWFSKSQSPELLLRLQSVSRKVFSKLRSGTKEEPTEYLLNKPSDLQEEMLKFERNLIRQALAKVNGSVTHAAPLLGITYQGLASAIESRHPDLLDARSPVRRRPAKKR
jgi:tetratricopeptide (TPR) repeat protein